MYLSNFEVNLKIKVPLNTEVHPGNLTVKEARENVVKEIPTTILTMTPDQLSKAIQNLDIVACARIK